MKYFIAITMFFLLASCGRLEINPEETTPNALACNFILPNNGDLWKCNLTQVKSLEDSLNYKQIRDATITLSYDNEFIEGFTAKKLSTNSEPPAYLLDLTNIPNIPAKSICELSIHHPSFPDLIAIDTMPIKPKIENVVTDISLIRQNPPHGSTGSPSLHFRVSVDFSFDLTLHDTLARYYMVVGKAESNVFNQIPIIAAFDDSDHVIDSIYQVDLNTSYDNILIKNGYGLKEFDSNVFEGDSIVHISGSISGPVLRRGGSIGDIYFDVMSISPAYYRYLQALKLANRNNSNVFTTPIDPFNNFEGGYGAFVLGNTERFVVKE